MGKFGTAHTLPGDKLEADISWWSFDIFVVVKVQKVPPDRHYMAQGLEDNVAVVIGFDVVQANDARQVEATGKGRHFFGVGLQLLDQVRRVCGVKHVDDVT